MNIIHKKGYSPGTLEANSVCLSYQKQAERSWPFKNQNPLFFFSAFFELLASFGTTAVVFDSIDLFTMV